MSSLTTSHAGKTYILTGGCSGIGLAILNILLSQSATVHVLDISSTPPQISAHLPQKNVHFYPNTDVSSRPSVHNAFTKILTITPTIDGLINNAGIASLPPVSGMESDESFDRTMEVNVRGVWNTGTEYLSRILPTPDPSSPDTDDTGPTEGKGVIVNIASTAAIQASIGFVSYTVSKHAVLGMTRAWAANFAHRGVRVNCVAPGGTDTPLVSGILDEKGKESYISRVPMGRLARPEEIANAVGFLLGGESSFMTGQVVVVDGGRYV
ncbi:NAD(P)-binding protein [Aspergillus sclerotioniger CBS 115572]|uniref:NAD(P)-binding protein n=1 Tax=Aspergillus sclerotioniger CBS 115572 TaxID=1450535 RepID=A0A317X3G1_9EURO|nr:NAD(P)-binding protein [Aspergillus sclerotioniger CBS 115572]PWY93159.1 NAD(P)-binding protein [Aspergillus sclerotioniger CBS 115572]